MADEQPAPPKSGKKGLIVWVLLALAAVGAGGALPWVLGGLPAHDAHPVKKKEQHNTKQEAIPFGDVLVNIGKGYLRVKILAAADEADAKEVTELLAKRKPFLKSWLIGYLSEQPADVSQKVNVNRLRREIRDQFNTELFPNGEEKIADILFDEFMVQ